MATKISAKIRKLVQELDDKELDSVVAAIWQRQESSSKNPTIVKIKNPFQKNITPLPKNISPYDYDFQPDTTKSQPAAIKWLSYRLKKTK
ncbi:MAG: hypothetical protein WCK98_00060 [bacterium]